MMSSPVVAKGPIRILIADDHPALREGLRTLIEHKNWVVCGEAANGRDAVAKAQELQPDLIILDLTMPVMKGSDALLEIRTVSPSTKVLVFTVHHIPTVSGEMRADGFVSKASSPEEIVAAIQELMVSAGSNRDTLKHDGKPIRKPLQKPLDEA